MSDYLPTSICAPESSRFPTYDPLDARQGIECARMGFSQEAMDLVSLGLTRRLTTLSSWREK